MMELHRDQGPSFLRGERGQDVWVKPFESTDARPCHRPSPRACGSAGTGQCVHCVAASARSRPVLAPTLKVLPGVTRVEALLEAAHPLPPPQTLPV